MEQDASTLNDYLTTFRRRKGLLIAVAFFVMLAFIAVTYSLPAVYRSTGTILIEQQDIPEELIPSTVSTYANERIQIVGQRVMSQENLAPIIERYDLYAEERQTISMNAAVELFRANTLVEPVSAEITDARGNTSLSTIAFTLSFDHKSPETAQKIANELAQLYLAENAESRTEAASQTSTFLSERAEQLEAELSDIEARMAVFKGEHSDALPSVMDLNRDRLTNTELAIIELEGQVRSLRDQRNLLQSELALISPYASVYTEEGQPVLTAQQRLVELQREYVTMASKYAPDHPDLVRVRKEIELLSGGEGAYADTAIIDEELAQRRAELQAAQQRYSADHPDVVRLTRVVEELEETRTQLAESGTGTSQPPTNPVYVQKQGQLTAASNELAAAEVRLQALRAEVAEYERRLSAAPEVEREYIALSRRYNSAVQQLEEVQAKGRTAALAASLETSDKGERFALTEPP
ncbi:MAG: GumC family protein, partial [Gammaproteobacteria bacterium]